MPYIILIMSKTTTDWDLLWPEIFHWDGRAACERFLENNLIREDGFMYGCAQIESLLISIPIQL